MFARRALKDKDLVEEAQIEHASAKTPIRQLERMKEEENEMFPKLRRVRLNLHGLGFKP